ncbi:retrotransposon protein, putative, ty1-copia subclass, partial [Tanacetum coccineum]
MTNNTPPVTVTPPVNTIGASVTNTVGNHVEKPEKFNGQNFKRWQQKMFFYLTTLNLARFLKETAPQVEPLMEDHNCQRIWESLERKYKIEDAGTKKFMVAHFLDYKMVDSKNVISQVQDLQVLLHDIHAEGMTLSETFQIAAIIEKLPPSWVEFKNYLKYKRKEMSVEDLVVRLRIEEGNIAERLTMESKLFMGNSATVDIKEIRKNLGYAVDAMFKLNVMVVKNDINKMNSSAYLIESSNVWHGRLGHYCYVYLLKSKDEAIDKFVLYKTEVENQLGKKIKVVRSDRGGEYVAPFAELYAKHGIRHEFTAPYSPQQNPRIAKGRKNIPRKEKEETPYELWMGRKPSYQYLRVWGCLAKVAVPTPKAQKIGPKSVDCIFIGYAKNSTAYRFIVHESKNPDIQKNTIMESRNASFFENIFPCLSKGTGSSSRLDDKVLRDKRQRDDNDLQDERQDQTDEEEVEPRRSKRARNEKSFGPDFVSFMVENEPTSYREAVTSSEGQQWREAIKSEIESILQNHTWELVDLPPGCKPLGYKWIFKKKMKADLPGQEGKVCRLVKLLYGLKQAPKQWHQKFDHTMLESGFKINEWRDKCVYVKDTSAGYVILCLYVDDMLIVGSSDKIIRSTKDMLKSKFDMKDMGLVIHLDIDIKDSRSTSGYVFTLGGAAISWKSSKQTVIAKSTMESEFIALHKCGEGAEWLRQFVEDIPRWPKPWKPVAYRLELPEQLSRVHSIFHVSNLKKCFSDEPLAISLDEIQIDGKLNFIEESIEIMDREVKQLKHIVKVRWNSRRGLEFTWEREDQMKKKYPHLFANPLRTKLF